MKQLIRRILLQNLVKVQNHLAFYGNILLNIFQMELELFELAVGSGGSSSGGSDSNGSGSDGNCSCSDSNGSGSAGNCSGLGSTGNCSGLGSTGNCFRF